MGILDSVEGCNTFSTEGIINFVEGPYSVIYFMLQGVLCLHQDYRIWIMHMECMEKDFIELHISKFSFDHWLFNW